jgi:hypothetical protein
MAKAEQRTRREHLEHIVLSPCSWAGFSGFWFISRPAQWKFVGPGRIGSTRAQRRLNTTLGWAGFTGWRFNHLAASCTASSGNWMGTNNKEWMEGNQVPPTI